MSTFPNTKLQELKGRFLELAKDRARLILEGLGRYHSSRDYIRKYPQVDLPKERATFLHCRAAYWANAMHLEAPKLQFRKGLQEKVPAVGSYFANEHVIVIDADLAKSNYEHLDALIAHEMGHAADRENILREGNEQRRFTTKAVSVGIIVGAGVAATTTFPVVPTLLLGLIAGLFVTREKISMSIFTIHLGRERRANQNVLDAGMPWDQLLRIYDEWRKPDGTFHCEFDEAIITDIEKYEGKREILNTPEPQPGDIKQYSFNFEFENPRRLEDEVPCNVHPQQPSRKHGS